MNLYKKRLALDITEEERKKRGNIVSQEYAYLNTEEIHKFLKYLDNL